MKQSATSIRRAAQAEPAANVASERDLGNLPGWNLTDLYESMEAPAFFEDMARAEKTCREFAERWRGKLEDIAGTPQASAGLEKAIAEYDAIEDVLGRIVSFADVTYCTDMTDQARGKFAANTRDRVTAMSSSCCSSRSNSTALMTRRWKPQCSKHRYRAMRPGCATFAWTSPIS